MLSDLKKSKFFCPTIGLLCVIALIVAVSALRPILWTDGTGISVTLDKWLWGNTTNIQRNEAKISKTVEIDKKGNIVKTIEINKYDYGKTVWDWLSVLGVPLTLLILGVWLQKGQQERADKLSKEQQERAEKLSREQQERAEKFSEDQQKIADNNTKEEVLHTYFDRLSVLLINKNLIALSNKLNSGEIKPEKQELLDSSLNLIRARTLSILRLFKNDTERKTSVIDFLIESDVIGKLNLDLFTANLSNAELPYAQLPNAKLSHAKLSNANLYNANLYNAKLDHADLDHAILSNASLCHAILCHADLSHAILCHADLSNANFGEADLSNANFGEADLSNADLLNITRNSETLWPADKRKFDNVKNIPKDLKEELNL